MKIKNDKLFIQITCLIFSVALWIMVMVQDNPIQDTNITNIPVTIRNLSALDNSNMIIMNSDKEELTVNVRVKGAANRLVEVGRDDFNAYIDVLGFAEGTQNAKVEIVGPSGVEIQSISPTRIPLIVEGVISKVMDVDVQYEGNQARNYYRGYGNPNPSSVRITGPRSVVDSARYAIATINIDGATNMVEKTVPVRIYNSAETEIFMSSPVDNVKVSVPIYPTKYVNVVPNIVGEPLEGYELVDVSVNPQRVRIAARQDILDTIRELNLEELDISASFHNSLSARKIINEDNVILLNLDSDPVVSVTVEEIIEKEINVDMANIEMNNINEDYSMNIIDEEGIITITASGPASLINDLTESDIKLSANLAEAIPGINTIPIEASTERELDIISLSKYTIEVELIENNIESNSEDLDE